MPTALWENQLADDHARRLEEGRYIESLRRDVAGLLPREGLSGEAFTAWFEDLRESGPGQQHPLFDWLARHCSDEQMRWFLTQEAAGEAGFEDLLACTQVKLPARPKLECARNYWDEMGHGRESAMHGGMLAGMVRELGLDPSLETTVPESLALNNTMIALAVNRRYAYQSLGALGAIELTAPGRVRQVSLGMRRLGFGPRSRSYFDLHAALDISHSRQWMREIIRPLVDQNPECAMHLAEGALMRLLCGERCFDRYSAEFGLDLARDQHQEAALKQALTA
jgi:Iron-containing redox enzyme